MISTERSHSLRKPSMNHSLLTFARRPHCQRALYTTHTAAANLLLPMPFLMLASRTIAIFSPSSLSRLELVVQCTYRRSPIQPPTFIIAFVITRIALFERTNFGCRSPTGIVSVKRTQTAAGSFRGRHTKGYSRGIPRRRGGGGTTRTQALVLLAMNLFSLRIERCVIVVGELSLERLIKG